VGTLGFESSAFRVEIKEHDIETLGDLIGDKDTARNMIGTAYRNQGFWVVTKELDIGTAGIYWDGTELIHGREMLMEGALAA
jgi:hypothetical protein